MRVSEFGLGRMCPGTVELGFTEVGSMPGDTRSVEVAGRRLVCPICGGEEFAERRTLLNTRCAFRPIRPPVPVQTGHPFRSKSTTCSGVVDQSL